jgi:hypothetical protein
MNSAAAAGALEGILRYKHPRWLLEQRLYLRHRGDVRDFGDPAIERLAAMHELDILAISILFKIGNVTEFGAHISEIPKPLD